MFLQELNFTTDIRDERSLLMVQALGDSNTVMRTGYIVPAQKPSKVLKKLQDKADKMGYKESSWPKGLLDKIEKLKKLKKAKAAAPQATPQATEREEYVRMPDGSLQKAKIKSVPVKNEAEKRDLWNKLMNSAK